jgi:hypothetical protein
MLQAGEVVAKARFYLDQIMPEFTELSPKVEEMVLSPDSSRWKITFVAHMPEAPKAESLADLLSRRTIEKVVDVGASDGSLIAVRNPIPF